MRHHPFQLGLARLVWLVGLAVFAVFAAATPVHAQSCPGQQAVESAAASFNQAAASGSPQAFAAAFDQHTDLYRVAMFALGPYRRALPKARRSEYVQLTRQFLGRFLAKRASRFAGARLRIVDCIRDAGYTYIDSRVGGRRVIWRLKGNRIIDVNFGGVWLLPQMREKFVSVIERGNGDPTALLDYLRSGRSFGWSMLSPGQSSLS